MSQEKTFRQIMDEVELQEKELVFDTFTYDDAHALGEMLYACAKEKGLAIAIDITRNDGQQLYHAALPGSAADNDQWMLRKMRVVRRFGHSSFYMNNKLQDAGMTIEEMSHVSSMEFAPVGGCFPVNVKNAGPVATVAVSGLPQHEDHAFLVGTLRKYLKK